METLASENEQQRLIYLTVSSSSELKSQSDGDDVAFNILPLTLRCGFSTCLNRRRRQRFGIQYIG